MPLYRILGFCSVMFMPVLFVNQAFAETAPSSTRSEWSLREFLFKKPSADLKKTPTIARRKVKSAKTSAKGNKQEAPSTSRRSGWTTAMLMLEKKSAALNSGSGQSPTALNPGSGQSPTAVAAQAQSRDQTAKAKRKSNVRHAQSAPPNAERRNAIIAMIRAQALEAGVPAWFALRIAEVESSYNPLARGAAGELGLFQMKCATARGIGFSGPCEGLLDANVNIRFGLKHLAIALRMSKGDMRLAASKHNGGLGYKKIRHSYVAEVF